MQAKRFGLDFRPQIVSACDCNKACQRMLQSKIKDGCIFRDQTDLVKLPSAFHKRKNVSAKIKLALGSKLARKVGSLYQIRRLALRVPA